MLDPIHIQSGSAQKRARWFSHAGLLLDHIHLGKTWHSQPEPNWNQFGFAQYDPGCLWKNTTKSESGKLVEGWLCSARNRAQWFLHTGLLLDEMRLTKTWPGHPDWIWVSFSQYGPGLLWNDRTKSDVGSWIWQIWSGLILTAQWP